MASYRGDLLTQTTKFSREKRRRVSGTNGRFFIRQPSTAQATHFAAAASSTRVQDSVAYKNAGRQRAQTVFFFPPRRSSIDLFLDRGASNRTADNSLLSPPPQPFDTTLSALSHH